MTTLYRENYYIIKGLIKNISVFFPLLVLLAMVNWFADPAQILKAGHYEQGMAEILLKGLNVANISNYDERLVQKHYISGLAEKRDVIVLGSSRTMQVNSAFFPNARFFNHGVSGASLEDYMAIFEMYEEKNQKPDIVILGLDAWVLNKNSGQARWRSIADYYERFLSRLGLKDKTSDKRFSFQQKELFGIEKQLQIISASYFQSSIRYLHELAIYHKEKGSEYYPTSLTELDVNVKLFDGSVSYKSDHRLMSASEVLRRAQSAVERDSMYSLSAFHELDREEVFKFERFVKYLIDQDIEIIFFFAPYHPYIYKHIIDSDEYKIVLEVESYFKMVALQNNIRVIGSYDPEISGFDERDFSDARHARREAIARLMR